MDRDLNPFERVLAWIILRVWFNPRLSFALAFVAWLYAFLAVRCGIILFPFK